MFTRRSALLGGAALLTVGGAGDGRVRGRRPAETFVRRDGAALRIGRRRYRYAGTNMWYAPWIGADAPFGNRDRLRRELDRLQALGVGNIRINGSAEQSPLRNSVRPAFRDNSRHYNETLLRGLDFTLAEMGRRDMKAVIYLTNFWEWSGGMMTYLYWTNGGHYINMNDPAHPWPEFPDLVSRFYNSPQAVAMYHDYIRAVVRRVNTITGRRYVDDPAIMAWQLANEPRPAGSEAVGTPNLPAFYAWVRATARLIKSLDPNHLVSTGSEGLKGCLESAACVADEHRIPQIDYLTCHVWPQNWGWIDPNDIAGTWPHCEELVRDYVSRHLRIAAEIGKPLVFEEFGFPREGGSYDPSAATAYKDRYYRLIYSMVLDNARSGGPVAGSNFWAWNGEGRAAHDDHRFHPGDTQWLGDPPHEPQGWYGVFDSDASTQSVIREHAAAMSALG